MTLLEVGRVCIKKYGRDAGSKAVITGVMGNGFVKVITTKRSRERQCNPSHLEFLADKVDVKDKAAIDKVLGVKPKVTRQSSEQSPQKAQKPR